LTGRFIGVTLDDPYSNLAAEEALFRIVRTPSLRVWENQRSVVIGRAQLAAIETDLDYCAAQGIPIVRRFTAGGAVYNGPGNINWTFFAQRLSEHRRIRYSNDAKEVFSLFGSIVAEALSACSVECRFVPPNRIETSMGKVSGMAAYISRDGLICHGTLLLNADLVEVARVSRPSDVVVERKYPRSRLARVANVGLGRDAFVGSILEAAGLDWGPEELAREELDLTASLREKYASPAWNLGDPFSLDDA
jgi:lipoate-protein ligase A